MWNNQKQQNLLSLMSNLQAYYHFKLDFRVPTYGVGKWLINGTKRRKDNHLQTWNSPVDYPCRVCKHDIKESKGNVFNPIFKDNDQGQKHPESCVFAEPELLM